MSEMNYENTLDSFMKECQVLVDDHMKQYSWGQKLTITKGRRYDKIVSEDVGHNFQTGSCIVWAFVDKTNGDILMPEGWKKPAKHARGNIYDEDRMLFVNHSGPAYMNTIKEYYGA
jgi:hypothetical protein